MRAVVADQAAQPGRILGDAPLAEGLGVQADCRLDDGREFVDLLGVQQQPGR